jgi:hypothetical protein
MVLGGSRWFPTNSNSSYLRIKFHGGIYPWGRRIYMVRIEKQWRPVRFQVTAGRSGDLFTKFYFQPRILPILATRRERWEVGGGTYRGERRRRRDPTVEGRAPRRRRRCRRDRRFAVVSSRRLSRRGNFSTPWMGIIFFQTGWVENGRDRMGQNPFRA